MSLFSSDFLARLERLAVRARRPASGMSYGRGRGGAAVGSGLEFVDVREYAPGDDLRAVDWNLYARHDKLLLRVYHQEREHDVHVLLDVSDSMSQDEEKWRRARQLAAAVAYIGLTRLDRVAVWPIADGTGGLAPPFPLAAGKRRVARLFRYLDALPAGGQTDLAAAADAFLRMAPSRGVAVLISDFYDLGGDGSRGTLDGIRKMLRGGFEVHAIQVVGADDAAPQARGRVALVDTETGAVIRGRVGARVRRRYEELLDAERARIAGTIRNAGGSFVLALPQRSLEDILLRDLRKSGVVE